MEMKTYHFALTFTVNKSFWINLKDEDCAIMNIANEIDKIVKQSVTNERAFLMIWEWKKNNTPHYHVYIEAEYLEFMHIKNEYKYSKFVYCKELMNIEHYTNYMLKYYNDNKICIQRCEVDTFLYNYLHDKILTFMSPKKSKISMFLGKTIEEYMNELNLPSDNEDANLPDH